MGEPWEWSLSNETVQAAAGGLSADRQSAGSPISRRSAIHGGGDLDLFPLRTADRAKSSPATGQGMVPEL